ncbi:MAG: hypothetical protein COT45_03505 [bacterium (Candidatus Stahlbacteria) CG08_land_8_20_14_0_20_40_26]|nr:MAG: hypothetical protein COX49_08685 [bacterium (Candidatus Stahlbacteria) CG23_combo_of_CG06-09_8_20_14_all_40_9]PIS24869.1 MAG: hypothetical protein COT45_03505 [bacterium (Candidatus Stahlbacteria) CG08_land_8_20_14_0_20_40_26]
MEEKRGSKITGEVRLQECISLPAAGRRSISDIPPNWRDMRTYSYIHRYMEFSNIERIAKHKTKGGDL